MSPTRVKRTSAIWLLIVFGVALGLVWFLTGTWGQSAAANPSPSLVPVVDPEPVGHLGGVTNAVFISGTLAYVGNGGELTIMNITDPVNPTEISNIWWKAGVTDIAVRGSYAYVAVANGLRIVDISNPVSLTLVGSYTVTSSVSSLALHDTQVYLGTQTGMQIVDITNLTNPTYLGVYEYNLAYYWPVDVASVGEYAYIALTYTTHVVDVTIPTLPTQVEEYGYSGKMSVVGDRLYMASPSWGMRILDVSQPDTPVELGFFIPPSDPMFWYPSTHSVKVVGNLAYISYIVNYFDPHYPEYWRLSIVNVMTPSTPVQVVDTSLLAFVPSYYSRDFEIVDDYAWAAVGRGGLLTFDLHEPVTPTLVSRIGVPPLSPVVVQNQFAYGLSEPLVSDYFWVFYVIDLTDPTRPQARGSLSMYAEWGLSGLWIKGSYAYTFSRSRFVDDVLIIDISDPDHPIGVGSYTYPDPQTSSPSTLGSTLAFKNNYLYVGNWGEMTIDIVDISDPTNPVRIGAVVTDRFCCLKVVGNYLYAEQDIYDISDPLSPVLVTTYPNIFNLGGLLVQNNRAYLADYESWHIFDVTNPVNPVLLSTWSTPSPPNYPALALWGNDLFVSYQTVSLLDVSDATNPVVKATFPIGGAPAVGGATIVLSNWSGLYVFDALSFLPERTYLPAIERINP